MNAQATAAPALAKFAPQIAELAAQAGLPLEAAEEIYRVELERLRMNARIVDFLPLLAMTNLKQQLRERRRNGLSPAHQFLKES